MAPGDKRPNTQARRIPDAPPSRGGPRDAGRRQAEVIRRLEAELRAAKEERQQLVEQLQRRNEELHTINEEATAMNEELTTLNGQLASSQRPAITELGRPLRR